MALLWTGCWCQWIEETTGTAVLRVEKNPAIYVVASVERQDCARLPPHSFWEWSAPTPGTAVLYPRDGSTNRLKIDVVLTTAEYGVARWFAARAADWQPAIFGNWLGGNANVPETMDPREGAWRLAVARFWDQPSNSRIYYDLETRDVCLELMQIAEDAWASTPTVPPDEALKAARDALIQRGKWPRAMPPPPP